ncbi:tunicamycin induced protein [Actinidia rufa]|uniref:Tunicamycin induced protein n=1 Tax=Actinidia rufa TaxID=165716 RepID=A0A7J0EUN3_9ERIC|nr:tunicamycin induced protein [Actinidia rufa]
MARRSFSFVTVCLVLFAIQLSSTAALISTPTKAISDLKEAIVKGLGFQADDFKISGFDLRDVLVGQSVAYEFDVEIGNKVVPLKLLEDVNRWEYVDLPVFREEDVLRSVEENGLVERRKNGTWVASFGPVSAGWSNGIVDTGRQRHAAFIAGVARIFSNAIFAASQFWLSLTYSQIHDVDAGELRKVILADGAVVTVKAQASRPRPCGAILTKSAKPMEPISAIDLQGEATSLLTPDQFTTLWPLTSINSSNSNLRGFEVLLSSVLGPKANEAGSFKLLKADVSARTFVKIGFGVEKKLKEGDGFDSESFPEWRTKPETVRMHFEVLAKVEGDEVVAERVMQVDPVMVEDSVAPNVLFGNTTMSKIPIVHPPPNPFSL